MLTQALKWAAIPVVLIAAPLSGMAGSYEPLLNTLVCVSAIILLLRAVSLHQYVWGGGLLPIAVAFGPFSLVIKIFLLLGLASIAACSAVLAGFRMQTAPVGFTP